MARGGEGHRPDDVTGHFRVADADAAPEPARRLELALIAVAPRHNEIKRGTARAICKDLEIPAPTSR